MHELGLVVHVIDRVERAARENGAGKVTRLTLEVGEVSSVVPGYFSDCFEWAKRKSELLQDAELELVILAGVTYCQTCGKTYATVDYGKKCPHCGSEETYLLTGNELKIRDIEVTD